MNKLQTYLLEMGSLLLFACVAVFYGMDQHWYYISYPTSMLIPMGFFIASEIFICFAVAGE